MISISIYIAPPDHNNQMPTIMEVKHDLELLLTIYVTIHLCLVYQTAVQNMIPK